MVMFHTTITDKYILILETNKKFNYTEENNIMPHVVIKTISGPSQKQLQEAAEQISKIINKTMGKPEKYICVAENS